MPRVRAGPIRPLLPFLGALACALAACNEPAQPGRAAAPAPAPAPLAAPAPAPGAAPVAAAPSPAEACADAWLKARGLNPFGDPPDTAYAGGNPLFDERTGARKDRVQHLFGKLSELKAACAARDGG